jgi:hypothetical protein
MKTQNFIYYLFAGRILLDGSAWTFNVCEWAGRFNTATNFNARRFSFRWINSERAILLHFGFIGNAIRIQVGLKKLYKKKFNYKNC